MSAECSLEESIEGEALRYPQLIHAWVATL